MGRVEVPAGEYEDIAAFELVEFCVDFYGSQETFVLDTKILKNGDQLVIDGNGFIASGTKI